MDGKLKGYPEKNKKTKNKKKPDNSIHLKKNQKT